MFGPLMCWPAVTHVTHHLTRLVASLTIDSPIKRICLKSIRRQRHNQRTVNSKTLCVRFSLCSAMSSPHRPADDRRSPSSDRSKVAKKMVPIKSSNDKLEYKFIELDNGLKALLISDPTYKDLKEGEEVIISETPKRKRNESTSSDYSSDSIGSDSDGCIGDKRFGRSIKKRSLRSISGEKLSAMALCVRSGSFSDPREVQGLAHLIEHVISMGSKKFPEENALDSFLTSRGGYYNALTEYEYTLFEIEVQRKHLFGALERFADCLVSPLLKADTIARETKPVNTEFMEAMNDDDVRVEQILTNVANSDHPFHNFPWGNAKSLKEMPKKNKIDTRKCVHEFVAKHYTPDNIHIVVQTQEPMDTIENWVRELFDPLVARKERLQPKPYGLPFDDNKQFHKFYEVRPINQTDELRIFWCLPPIIDHFKTSPLDYWGHVVGHEGKGSLISRLRKENLGLELSAGISEGGFHSNKFSSMFLIQIKLTAKGGKMLDTIIDYVFEYMQMLRQLGPQEWFFNELKQIEDNRFHWSEEKQAIDNVKSLAVCMNHMPVKYVLRGKFYKTFDEQLLKRYMDLMRPEKASFMRLCSGIIRSSHKECQKEKWFGTKYQVKEVPKLWLKESDIRDGKSMLFHFPEPNPFVAKNFELKKPKEPKASYPSKVLNENRLKLWYKSDDKFNLPKAIVRLHIISNFILECVDNAVMIDLFIEILGQVLSEDTYAASLAGFWWKLAASPVGITVLVSGFNDKLDVLLETIVAKMANFDVDDRVFTDVKKHLSDFYHDDFIDPTNWNKGLRLAILSHKFYNTFERSVALHRVDKKSLKDFLAKYFGQMYVEALIQGNLTQDESVNLMKSVGRIVHLSPDWPPLEEPQLLTTKIPVGSDTCRVLALSDQTNKNSSITNYYQSGLASIRLQCLHYVLTSVMEEPCFNILRTKEGLGYYVCASDYDTNGVSGFGISVNSSGNDFDCTHVDNRIESFIKFINELIDKDLNEDKFKEHVNSLITAKKMPDLQLREEFDRNWGEIVSFTYGFDRWEKEIKCLDAISFQEFKTWALEQLSHSPHSKRKLSIQIVGYGEKSLRECVTFEGKEVELKTDLDSDNSESESNRVESSAAQLRVTYLKPKMMDKSGINYIADYDQYRRRLELYPINKVVE